MNCIIQLIHFSRLTNRIIWRFVAAHVIFSPQLSEQSTRLRCLSFSADPCCEVLDDVQFPPTTAGAHPTTVSADVCHMRASQVKSGAWGQSRDRKIFQVLFPGWKPPLRCISHMIVNQIRLGLLIGRRWRYKVDGFSPYINVHGEKLWSQIIVWLMMITS